MKFFKIILKLFGITAFTLVVLFIGLVVVAHFMFGSNEKAVDSNVLLKSSEFRSLHQSVVSLDNIENIAVLPDKNYIVINGTVINLAKQTFGYSPELGFYNSYYEEGDRTPYTSLDSLLNAHSIKIDSVKAMAVIKGMKDAGISDVGIRKEGISYRWKVSAMYGEEGILYSSRKIPKDSTRFDLFENIEEDFYHFAVYN
ncbi:hypothetical protein [Pontibacter lucknowensis]|nr:hypothetical protein [Pontibacter lucknowensis]